MFFDTSTLFTIGQFAKLHEINKKTLMWYDEIGLLKPAFIKDNGYRCYTYQQSSVLETILMLRELDVPLADIKYFLDNRSAHSLEALFADKAADLEEKIAQLQTLQANLTEKQQQLSALHTLDVAEISIIEKTAPHYFATIATTPDAPFEHEIGLVIAEAKKHHLHRLHDASYGAMLPVSDLYAGHYSNYTTLFIELPAVSSQTANHIQAPGTYLRAYCKGNWDNLPKRYEELLDYANSHHLQFTGFSYEKGLNEALIDTFDDYITQIDIPVQKINQ